MIDAMATHGQISAVGGDAQCIYIWRDTNIRSIIEFSQRYPQLKVIEGQVNYRRMPEMSVFANAIPISERIEDTKNLRSTKNPFRESIMISVFNGRQQANCVIQRLAD
jgi:DNA helicase-2/ATP-dependent DNA helicase PcrA